MKRQRWMTFAMIVLIFVGLGIMLYPTANDVYNRWKANRELVSGLEPACPRAGRAPTA